MEDAAVFLVALARLGVAAEDALLLVEERVVALAAGFLAGLVALVFAADLALLPDSGCSFEDLLIKFSQKMVKFEAATLTQSTFKVLTRQPDDFA